MKNPQNQQSKVQSAVRVRVADGIVPSATRRGHVKNASQSFVAEGSRATIHDLSAQRAFPDETADAIDVFRDIVELGADFVDVLLDL